MIQLRQEDEAATAYNLVGFQTRMKYAEQLRVFRTIPGLEEAEFLRMGSVHRNTFVNAPELLGPTMELLCAPGVYLAGQVSGVEGYVESAAGGFLCALFLAQKLRGEAIVPPPATTALGASSRTSGASSRATSLQHHLGAHAPAGGAGEAPQEAAALRGDGRARAPRPRRLARAAGALLVAGAAEGLLDGRGDVALGLAPEHAGDAEVIEVTLERLVEGPADEDHGHAEVGGVEDDLKPALGLANGPSAAAD